MRVRGIDINNDWLFGKGQSDYKTARDAVAQDIKTRLQSFLGDCFFALEAGVDWFHLLGGKSVPAISLSVRTTILNTEGVTKLNEISVTLDEARLLTLVYSVNTIYGEITNEEQINLQPGGGFILQEDGFYILQENGGKFVY